MSYSYMDTLESKDLVRYKQKLEFVDLPDCPYRLPASKWINNPTKWPEVTYSDIYTYLIESPGVYTKHTMKNYRSLEAHGFFTSGWVQTVLHWKPENGTHIVLKADVRPSWRVTETPHHPWIAVKPDGTVNTAHCDCMAGLGESCSHVGGLLFKVEAAVRLGYTSLACTSVPCQWNACFTKNVSPAIIADVKFYNDSATQRIKNMKKRKLPPPKATKSEQGKLLGLLATAKCSPIGLSTFNGYANNFKWKQRPTLPSLPTSLRVLYYKKETSTAGPVPSISNVQADLVEKKTLGQSRSMAWHEQRAGRITGSTAHNILRTNPSHPAPTILKSLCVPQYRPLKQEAVVWGTENENMAFAVYTSVRSAVTVSDCTLPAMILAHQQVMGDHDGLTFTNAGFRISTDTPQIGASPDGYVECSCCGKGVVEVKCPFNWAKGEVAVQQWPTESGGHLQADMAVNPNHRYYTQVQIEMYVTGGRYCDFVTWTPHACVLSRVQRNEPFINNAVENLTTFWETHVLPELCTRQIGHGAATPMPSTSDAHLQFCKCGEDKPGAKMVGCDNSDCRYQWFHYSCVGLKRGPRKGTWFCSKKCEEAVSKPV